MNPLKVEAVILWPGMMTAALSLGEAIFLCTHCSQEHLDDALDWDEGGCLMYQHSSRLHLNFPRP